MRILTVLVLTLMAGASAFGQDSGSVSCTADARWTNSNGSVNFQRSSQTPLSLSLLVHVSNSNCAPANITVTATFLSDTQDLICSGTIFGSATPPVMTAMGLQMFNLEVRPFIQNDFLRWRNAPGVRGLQTGKRMACMNLDGTAEVGDSDRQKAAWVRLSIGVFPKSGGLGIAEALIRVMP